MSRHLKNPSPLPIGPNIIQSHTLLLPKSLHRYKMWALSTKNPLHAVLYTDISLLVRNSAVEKQQQGSEN